MRIVRAEVGHADRLSEIAKTAKAHWDYPASWMHAWRDSLTIRPDQITANDYHVVQSDDGQPVGFYGVHRTNVGWRLEDLWVLPEWHGRGVGRQLFEHAAALVHGRGGDALLIQTDPNAEGFYLRMGAVRTGEVDATMSGVPRDLPVLRYALV